MSTREVTGNYFEDEFHLNEFTKYFGRILHQYPLHIKDMDMSSFERSYLNVRPQKHYPNTDEQISLSIEHFIIVCIPFAIHFPDELGVLRKRRMWIFSGRTKYTSINISYKELNAAENSFYKIKAFNDALAKTAENNNKGIAFEKSKDIESAIACYEENIKAGYPATHAFNRLIVIYRRRKQFADEIRVLNRAIEVFGSENERLYNNAILKYPEHKDDIDLAFENNSFATRYDEDLKRNVSIFIPYDLIKYLNRLDSITSKYI